MSTVTTLTCTSLYCYHTDLYLSVLLSHQPVSTYCYHTDLSLSPHWPVPVSIDLCQSLLLPPWALPVSTITTDLYVSVLLPHWPVPAVTTLTCTACCHWHVHVSTVTSLTCAQYMSLLLPLWPVLVSTFTTLIYTCLPCFHTDLLYLSTVTTLTCPSLYCYHTDMNLSVLLPLTYYHRLVPSSTVVLRNKDFKEWILKNILFSWVLLCTVWNNSR